MEPAASPRTQPQQRVDRSHNRESLAAGRDARAPSRTYGAPDLYGELIMHKQLVSLMLSAPRYRVGNDHSDEAYGTRPVEESYYINLAISDLNNFLSISDLEQLSRLLGP